MQHKLIFAKILGLWRRERWSLYDVWDNWYHLPTSTSSLNILSSSSDNRTNNVVVHGSIFTAALCVQLSLKLTLSAQVQALQLVRVATEFWRPQHKRTAYARRIASPIKIRQSTRIFVRRTDNNDRDRGRQHPKAVTFYWTETNIKTEIILQTKTK